MTTTAEKQGCSAFTSSGGYHRNRCTRPGSVKEEQKWWCRQHAPSAVAERARKRDELFEERWAKQRQSWAEAEERQERAEACVNAFHSPTRSIATENIPEGLVWELVSAVRAALTGRAEERRYAVAVLDSLKIEEGQ